MEYRNNFDFDLLITCNPIENDVTLVIKTVKHDKWDRPFHGIVTTIPINRKELESFILSKNCWIEDIENANVISVAPIQ